MTESDIISIGSATRDVFVTSEDMKSIESSDSKTGKAILLNLGSKIQINKLVLSSGGGGTNAAVTFARQGFNTACIGVIGDDANVSGFETSAGPDVDGTKYVGQQDVRASFAAYSTAAEVEALAAAVGRARRLFA